MGKNKSYICDPHTPREYRKFGPTVLKNELPSSPDP